MFWDFGQPKSFVSRKKDFASPKKFFVSQNKHFCVPEKVAPNKERTYSELFGDGGRARLVVYRPVPLRPGQSTRIVRSSVFVPSSFAARPVHFPCPCWTSARCHRFAKFPQQVCCGMTGSRGSGLFFKQVVLLLARFRCVSSCTDCCFRMLAFSLVTIKEKHVVHALSEQSPDVCIVSIDDMDTFDLVCGGIMLQALLNVSPSTMSFVRQFCGTSSRYLAGSTFTKMKTSHIGMN